MHQLLQTTNDYIYLLVRLVAGVIIFPYGMQKLLGWFDDFGGGVGIKETLVRMHEKKIPAILAWLIILGQSLGSVGLILGFLGRVAAGANLVIFAGAMITHMRDGWVMNWIGKKKGEGIEYFIMLLSLLLVVLIKGSGPLSVDAWLTQFQ